MSTLKGKQIGLALTGSHCTLGNIFPQVEKMIQAGAEIFPIMSAAVQATDTRFGAAAIWVTKIKELTGRVPWSQIEEVEPIGPQKLLDLLLIAPCTGNTMAKLANGVTDSGVLMAAKAQLRNCRPVVVAISTNDGLGLNAKNLATLLNTRHIYLVPFGQDDPRQKPNSLVAREELIIPTLREALQGKQIQPVLMWQETGRIKAN
ncbi:MAG: dipicolinate synthase subunit B [Firmicutes bacterium]|nr:dipicolinate synthase subunit B [Bacillota bacterium]